MKLFETKHSSKRSVVVWYPDGTLVVQEAIGIWFDNGEYTIESPYMGSQRTFPKGSKIMIDISEVQDYERKPW